MKTIWNPRRRGTPVAAAIVFLGSCAALFPAIAPAADDDARAAAAGGGPAFPGVEAEGPLQGEEIAVLTDPPEVPPPIARKHRMKVVVHLEVREKPMRLADGVEYVFWTFGNTVPGKFIRVREGDFVEFHLKNHPESMMPHNIDLHAVTGPGGGATASFTAPGHESVFSFTAMTPGLFVYQCATTPVGMHVASGMYGLILVEPKEGMTPVDREFYVMQGEFYTKGKYGEAGRQPFSMAKALDERPDYVVFNGAVGSLLGERALQAEVGERVRFFLGNAGPSLASSFRIIGEVFDSVQIEGGSQLNRRVQTTMIPPGGATIAELTLDLPGSYYLVDRSLFRAFNKGALGMLKVEGDGNVLVYSGRMDDRIYLPEGSAIQEIPQPAAGRPVPAATKKERIARGEIVYNRVCIACHQPDGEGIPNAFPPLANADYLNADIDRAISIVAHGYSGPMTVNGVVYNSIMPKLGLSSENVANALTYVLNRWDNSGGEVTPQQVEAVVGRGKDEE